MTRRVIRKRIRAWINCRVRTRTADADWYFLLIRLVPELKRRIFADVPITAHVRPLEAPADERGATGVFSDVGATVYTHARQRGDLNFTPRLGGGARANSCCMFRVSEMHGGLVSKTSCVFVVVSGVDVTKWHRRRWMRVFSGGWGGGGVERQRRHLLLFQYRRVFSKTPCPTEGERRSALRRRIAGRRPVRVRVGCIRATHTRCPSLHGCPCSI